MSRQAAYEKRQREKGMALVKIWVPEKDVEAFKAYAASLRNQAKKDGNNPCM